MEGTVINRFPLESSTPIAGALISTSLDSVTTTSDAAGHFHLVTNTPFTNGVPCSCTTYTVTIVAPGFPTFTATNGWGAHGGSIFALSPPP